MFSWNRLHAGVKAIFFVQVVNRLGDFVVPFLTLILTQIQGLSPALAGLVVTLATGLGGLGGLVAGRLADRWGRRDVLVAFLGISGLLLGAAGFAPGSPGALVAMVAAEFFLGAMRPTLGALVADLTDPTTRRAAFSLSYLGINLGVSVGPLLAGWLFQHALPWMFWLDTLTTAAALGILVRFVPRQTLPRPGDGIAPEGPRSSWQAFLHHPVLVPLGLLVFVYNLAYSQMIFTLALQMVDLFGAQGPALYGTVWGCNAVAVLILTPVALRVTKTWANLTAMAWGMGFFAVGTAIFLFHPTLPWVFGSTVLWTTGEVLFSIQIGELITSQSPGAYRARFQGYLGFLGGGGFVASPVLAGVAVQSLGLSGVWWIATGLALAVGAGFGALGRRVSR